MLVTAEEMLKKAVAGKYAVGQFNINNLEWTKAILLTAQELNSPVILGVSEGAGKYMAGFRTVAAMVRGIHDYMGITVPVAIHLDHGSYDGAKACIEAGLAGGSEYFLVEQDITYGRDPFECLKTSHDNLVKMGYGDWF